MLTLQYEPHHLANDYCLANVWGNIRTGDQQLTKPNHQETVSRVQKGRNHWQVPQRRGQQEHDKGSFRCAFSEPFSTLHMVNTTAHLIRSSQHYVQLTFSSQHTALMARAGHKLPDEVLTDDSAS